MSDAPNPDSPPSATDPPIRSDYWATFRLVEFRYLLWSLALTTLANRATLVVIGYQIYEHTRDPLALGWLGLVEVIPVVSLALFGGHIADRSDRRWLVLATDAVSIVCALLFFLISRDIAHFGVLPLYGVVFLLGLARGFGNPATNAFEAQVVPRELYVNAATWLSSVWQGCSIFGFVLAGQSYAHLGAANTYAVLGGLFALAWGCIWMIAPKPTPPIVEGESVLTSIAAGVKFVFSTQELAGSMALDLFAVFFGGAMALIPVFAEDILHVGPQGAGMLYAAPGVGALLVMLWCTRHPPARNAGRWFLICVAGFGVAMIVFGLSRSFYLSLAALGISGACDGLSVVVRKSILRLMTPEHLRGRVSSVGSIFISSSNELGAFESGVAAKLLGTVPSVVAGGIATLFIVAGTALFAPRLLRLDLSYRPDPEAETDDNVTS